MYKYIFFICLSCSLHGVEVNRTAELQQIEKQLESLKEQMHRVQLAELHEEVEEQSDMLANWGKASQTVQNNRRLQQRAAELQQQIERLEKQKAQLSSSS